MTLALNAVRKRRLRLMEARDAAPWTGSPGKALVGSRLSPLSFLPVATGAAEGPPEFDILCRTP